VGDLNIGVRLTPAEGDHCYNTAEEALAVVGLKPVARAEPRPIYGAVATQAGTLGQVFARQPPQHGIANLRVESSSWKNCARVGDCAQRQ